MEQFRGPITYGIIILIVICAIIILWAVPDSHQKDLKHLEHFMPIPSDFLIFNYLPKYKISIDVVQTAPDTQVIGYDPDSYYGGRGDGDVGIKMNVATDAKNLKALATVKPLKTEGLTKQQVSKFLKPGNVLKFYVVKNGKKHHYSDYVVNTRQDERIKNLHVGMITTRFVGRTTDNLNLATTAANAGSGSAWVVIHNVTALPLSLNNGEIKVEPHSTFRYLGYFNSGVTLGTYFKDDDEIYPDFQYLQPHSDLYYGIISDLQQPLQGCFQYGEDFNDNCEYGQTLWPFQDGIY